jgi:hypothetical protein
MQGPIAGTRDAQAAFMKTSFLGFAMVLTAMTGCNATVSNGNCEEPEPGGSGGCGATWECIDGEWVDTSEQAVDNCLPPSECPATLPEFGSPCNGSTQCEYPGTDEECGDPNQPFYAGVPGADANRGHRLHRLGLRLRLLV